MPGPLNVADYVLHEHIVIPRPSQEDCIKILEAVFWKVSRIAHLVTLPKIETYADQFGDFVINDHPYRNDRGLLLGTYRLNDMKILFFVGENPYVFAIDLVDYYKTTETKLLKRDYISNKDFIDVISATYFGTLELYHVLQHLNVAVDTLSRRKSIQNKPHITGELTRHRNKISVYTHRLNVVSAGWFSPLI